MKYFTAKEHRLIYKKRGPEQHQYTPEGDHEKKEWGDAHDEWIKYQCDSSVDAAKKLVSALENEMTEVKKAQEEKGFNRMSENPEKGDTRMEELEAKRETVLKAQHHREMKSQNRKLVTELAKPCSENNFDNIRNNFEASVEKEFEYRGLEPVQENRKECRRIAKEFARHFNSNAVTLNKERYVMQIDVQDVDIYKPKEGPPVFDVRFSVDKEIMHPKWYDKIRGIYAKPETPEQRQARWEREQKKADAARAKAREKREAERKANAPKGETVWDKIANVGEKKQFWTKEYTDTLDKAGQ